MIVVTGATGNVGREVVGALAAGGVPVRAVSRRTPPPGTWPDAVEHAVADLDRPETLVGPLTGARALFLLSGYADMPGLLSTARAAGVGRVVLLSSSSVPSGDMDNAVAAYHIRSERAVRESGLAHTSLRPSAFASNALQWADQLAAGDVVRAAFPDVPAAVIDPADIGAVAARVLVEGGHDGQALRLTGPQALLPAERVRILGEVLGRPLRFEGLTDDEARAEYATSMPPHYVEAFFKFYVDGDLDESPVLPTVREVLGRDPRTFRDWATANAPAFGGRATGGS
jgi:uncharacterized protein YbjT (DUF2867 family)